MKLKDYAEKIGVSYMTAYRWAKSGKIPNCVIMPTGTIIINENEIPENEIKKDTNDILENINMLRKEFNLKFEKLLVKTDNFQEKINEIYVKTQKFEEKINYIYTFLNKNKENNNG